MKSMKKIQRPKVLDPDSFRYGVELAVEVASVYDKYSTHPFLVSECILGKLNLLKGRPKKNRAARDFDWMDLDGAVLRKVESLEGTM